MFFINWGKSQGFKGKWTGFIIGMILILFVIVFTSPAHAANSSDTLKIVSKSLEKIRLTAGCDISTLKKRIIQSNGFDLLIINDNQFHHYAKNAGDPVLPVKILSVFIPEGYEFEKIEQVKILSQTVLQVSNIYPKQLESPLSSKIKQAFIPLNKRVAGTNNLFPETSIEYVHTANIRGSKIAVFRFWPVRFAADTENDLSPGKGRLYINDKIEYTFTLKKLIRQRKGKYKKSVLSSFMDNYVQSMVINPEAMVTESDLAVKGDEIPLGGKCDYLIITNQNLVPNFQVLASYRQEMGLDVDVISVEDIYSLYQEGASNQDKIKQCIKEYATQKGTVWVLLGGDNIIVPDYDCFASVNSGDETDNTIPTDLFYAGLDDMDWNDDGDDRACECNADGDSIDLYPDIFIGRAPVRSKAATDAFVSKVIAYERAVYDPFFHESVLLMGIKLWQIFEDKSDAHWRNEALWDKIHENMAPVLPAQKYRFYDTGTDFAGDADYAVTSSHLVEQISSGYGIMFANTHGGYNLLSLEGSNNFFTGNVAECVNKTSQGIIYTTACNTNQFDASTDPALSEAFIRSSDGGSVAYIGSSRYGWGFNLEGPDFYFGPSMDYALEFFKCLYYNEYLNIGGENYADSSLFKKRLGAVFASHKLYYIPSSTDGTAKRWLQFSLNLMGDPFMKVMVKLPHDSDLDRDVDGEDIARFIMKTEPLPPDLWEIALRFGKLSTKISQ